MPADVPLTIDRDRAIADPAAVFVSPEQVAHHEALALGDKILVLRRWQAEVADEPMAEEVDMAGGEPGLLDRITATLDHLESQLGDEPPPRRPGS